MMNAFSRVANAATHARYVPAQRDDEEALLRMAVPHVSPHHLFGVSFPCQETTAHIVNGMADARADRRFDLVAYRGTQSRKGRNNCMMEAAYNGVASTSGTPFATVELILWRLKP